MDKHLKGEAKYWDKFEDEVSKYGIPIWIDYQKANIKEIPFINFSTNPLIDRLYLGEVKDMVIKKAGKGKILDLGCGAGWLCLELARNGAQVKGIDISKKRIQIAKRYAKREGIIIDYSIGNIDDCSWESNNKYSVIVNWNSLHHSKNPQKILKSIKKSLKKGGIFISWDHLGDNFIINLAAKCASLIPGYYKLKVKSLGSIHSEGEGITDVRITKDIVNPIIKVTEYREYFIFIHLIPSMYKFLFRIGIPTPLFLVKVILQVATWLDKQLAKILPGGKNYAFLVAKKGKNE
ncbi:MAG: methyltransferase domain-containing protein [Candidatus Daviesbacteria bacterium]|nr:methyltransferase domain-containing protein [Candidatus Daviesbacteria bacterium]